MNLASGLPALLLLPAIALAQPSVAITATPLPPPTMGSPAPNRLSPPVQQQQPQADQQPQAGTPQPTQMTWLPQGSAQLQVLDKVNAQSRVLSVKVGQEQTFGSLTIQVQACDIHAANQPQDSAAYLTITDNHPDAPGFQGWMLANEPSVSMLQNPIYDVRVVGCQA
jgi:hypothetical protein